MTILKYNDIVTPELLEGAVEHYSEGYVSDYHILHCLLKKYQPKTFLEIGTHIGTGTKIIKNALGPGSVVYSLDLLPEQAAKSAMHPTSEGRNQAVGSACDLPFIQLLATDSLEFDYSELPNIEGFFIDADHDYDHPYHETLIALKHNPKIIIWHDADAPQVSQAIFDAIDGKGYVLIRVENTRMAFAIKPVEGGAFVYTKPNGEAVEFTINEMVLGKIPNKTWAGIQIGKNLLFETSYFQRIDDLYEFFVQKIYSRANVTKVVSMGEKVKVEIPEELLKGITIK